MCQISIYVFSLQHHQNKLRSGTNGHFSSFLRLLRALIKDLSLLTGSQYKTTPLLFQFQDERSLHSMANQFFLSPEKFAQLPLCRFENLLLYGLIVKNCTTTKNVYQKFSIKNFPTSQSKVFLQKFSQVIILLCQKFSVKRKTVQNFPSFNTKVPFKNFLS